MSFRIKSTHELLPTAPPQSENTVINYFTDTDEKKNNTPSYTYTTTQAPTRQSHPTQGSVQGMAIRSIPFAQPDHM